MKRLSKYSLILLLCLFFPGLALASEKVQYVIHGVSGDILTNIQSRLAIEQKPSTAMVRDAITPYGYFNPLITTHTSQRGSQSIITYNIQLGKPVLINRIDIDLTGSGNHNRALRKFMAHFPMNNHAIFTAQSYNTAKTKWLEIANNQGYIKAEYTVSNVLINTNTRTAAIILHLNTNERYFFGHLLFGKTPYSDEFLQRFNIFKRHPPFSSAKLIHYQQQMNQTSYFNQVLVIPDFQHETADRHIPVRVSISTPKAHRYTAGLGYGTFTGPRLTAGITFRRLTDSGQSLDAQIKLSSVLSGLAMKYYIPGKNPLYDQWLLGTSYQSFKPKNGQSTSRSIMGGYLYKSDHWQRSLNLNYMLERYSITNVNIPATDAQVLYPSLNVGYVKADNLVSPHFGKSLNLTLQGASENALSSTSFLQGELKGKYFYTPVSFAHIIFRADIGYTVVHDLNDLPLSLRYFAGGITSIRGYPDSSIGPGRYLEVASIEYRNHITENWDAAIFYDTGIATNHIGDPLNKAEGVGIVYESIIGPVKLYLARAISKRDRPYQVEFSVGPEF